MLSLNAATEITVLLGTVAHACYPALRRLGLEDSPGLQSEILLRRGGGGEKGIALYLVFLCVSPLDCEFFVYSDEITIFAENY